MIIHVCSDLHAKPVGSTDSDETPGWHEAIMARIGKGPGIKVK